MSEKIKTSQVKAQISKLRNNTNLAAVLSRMGANTMTARTVPAFLYQKEKRAVPDKDQLKRIDASIAIAQSRFKPKIHQSLAVNIIKLFFHHH